MSYDKTINNYVIKFKDEQSYLEARLENLKLYADIPFFGFIQGEMYDKDKCEVESIEPAQYMGEATDTNGSWSASEIIIGDSGVHNIDFSSGTNSIIIDGDLVVNGTITTTDGSIVAGNTGTLSFGNSIANYTVGHNTEEQVEEEVEQIEKEPEDPIDSRFDILDL